MSKRANEIYLVETTDGFKAWVLAKNVMTAIAKFEGHYDMSDDERIKDVTLAGTLDVF